MTLDELRAAAVWGQTHTSPPELVLLPGPTVVALIDSHRAADALADCIGDVLNVLAHYGAEADCPYLAPRLTAYLTTADALTRGDTT